MSFIDNAKDLAKLLQQYDNLEVTQKVIDLQREALEMQEELSRLREELKAQKDVSDRDSKLVIIDHMYFLQDDAVHESRRGPFCSHCYDSEGKLVHMHGNTHEGFRCRTCGQKVDTPASKAHQEAEFQKLQEQQNDLELGSGW